MSSLTRISLANRAVIALATLITIGAGLWATVSLKQELIPSMDIPMAGVVTVAPGAGPESVERDVTDPIERAVDSVEGVNRTTSNSGSGFSVVTVELDYGTDMTQASQELQQAINRVTSGLPNGAEPELILGSIDDMPVVQLAAASGANGKELLTVLQDEIVPALESLTDVRDVELVGLADDVIKIQPDNEALAAAGLSAQSIMAALEANGSPMPVGTITKDDQELAISVGESLTSVDDIAALPLKSDAAEDAPVVALGDVAEVERVTQPADSISRTNGQDSIGITITKTPDGNTVEVSQAVRDALPDLEEQLGESGEISIIFDQAPFIEQSIEDLATEGGLGLVFAVLIILAFLLSVRPTLVTAVSIPLSILITMIGLKMGGDTLNILTLGALTVAIGRVVDDSIVVIENIERHLRPGISPMRTIVPAVKEVAGAITSSTLVTVAVFIPIALVGGQVGELFRPFAFTISVALLASLLVALTIVPVLASWFIKAPKSKKHAEQSDDPMSDAPDRLQRSFLPSLHASLRHPVITLVVAGVVLGGTFGLANRLETDFIGDAGENTFTVTQTLPAGTSLEASDEAIKPLEEIVSDLPHVATYQVSIGSNEMAALFGGGGGTQSTIAVTVDIDTDVEEVEDLLRERIDALDDPDSIRIEAGSAGFSASSLEVVIQANDDAALRDLAAEVEDRMRNLDGAGDVSNNFAETIETVDIAVDRKAAAQAGTSEQEVSQFVATALNGIRAGELNAEGGKLDIYIETGPVPESIDDLEQVVIPTSAGMVPLAQVASVSEVEQPVSISRIDGHRSATVTAKATGSDLGAVTADLRSALDGIDLPENASVEVAGVSVEQEEAFADLGVAMLVAIAIVYLIMVATFRSLVQPLILLVSVPFAATGAIGLLLITGIPLGVASMIGLLMLVGIVVTNAIVLIDLVNQYRKRGLSVYDAVVEGARHRLRPILMTALATIGALMPMALGITGGSVFISQPLAIVVIGGLISSTALTLVLVPVLYLLVERVGERRRNKLKQKNDPNPEQAQLADQK